MGEGDRSKLSGFSSGWSARPSTTRPFLWVGWSINDRLNAVVLSEKTMRRPLPTNIKSNRGQIP